MAYRYINIELVQCMQCTPLGGTVDAVLLNVLNPWLALTAQGAGV